MFTSFAAGPPAAGLLVLRAVAGVALIVHMATALDFATPVATAMTLGSGGMGALLVVGLWTPIVGALAAIDAIWIGLSPPRDPVFWLFVAAVSLSLALLGPGKWSLDARLFGWKRVDFGDGRAKDRSPD